ncbi:MAG: hypothetical protein VR70_10515 [Rhodospirillaceae bacterium BRH_c57]|nr:MAG: hypothetical protein VR70_10515 [Rhodospirillaceae bacterium BRH_c57]
MKATCLIISARSVEMARQSRAARLLVQGVPTARLPHDVDLCPLCFGDGELVTPNGETAWCGACAGTGETDGEGRP